MSRNFEFLEKLNEDRELFKVPTLATPAPGKAATIDIKIPRTDLFAEEELLKLTQRLFLTSGEKHVDPTRHALFCGIESGEEIAQLCVRVGRTLAEQVQSQVCIFDASSRPPQSRLISRGFDVSPLLQSKNIRDYLQPIADNLWLISSQSVTANDDALSLDQMRGLITKLKREFYYTIICAAPLGAYNDGVMLGTCVDGVVLVLQANSTRRMSALRAKRALEAASVTVLGTVLNNRTFPIPEGVYRWL